MLTIYFAMIRIVINDSTDDPRELNLFVDKQKLFKVEVSDANLFRKKMTEEEDIIKRFISLHWINVHSKY